MAIIELSTALVAAGSGLVVPFVNKVLEKSAQRIGGQVDEHLAALFTRAHEYLAATGREPQSVEAKIAIPLLQAAALESDPTLAEKWAALLANAADPAQNISVQTSFIEILRQLSPAEASLLSRLFTAADEIFQATGGLAAGQRVAGRKQDATQCLLHLGSDYHNHVQPEGNFDDAMHQVYDSMLDNLVRQQLIEFAVPDSTRTRATHGHKQERKIAFFTSLGYDFMLAVTPPTP